MKFTFAISPCPNDTFMFEAIINNRIDLKGLEFEFILEDVDHLNKAALHYQYDISKISYNAYTTVSRMYQLLNSGSALGHNCGPLLISKKNIQLKDLSKCTVAIPGVHTTANLLLSIAYPQITRKQETIFSNVENMVAQGETELGLIIHENRFTYESRGLKKVADLGEHWEETTQSPIPLGGIAIKREFSDELKLTINQILRDSIQYAFDHKEVVLPFVKLYAQEMDVEVMKSHISLYVNEQSIDLDDLALDGIQKLFAEILIRHPDRIITHPVFVK